MRPFVVVLCALVVAVYAGIEVEENLNSSAPLKIFILPHSHDDVGWLETITEYYDNFVHSIYTTAVESLMADKRRRFQCVEQAYFSRWWADASATQRQQVKQLVEAGQFEFAVGGWAMPDEAVADYESLIETMTMGHEFIVENFGIKPRFGFQVDPFGASSAFAMQSAKFGFDAHIISRIDYSVKNNMQNSKTMEFIWRPSPSLEENAEIFTHLMDQYSYCSPFGADFVENGGWYWNGDDSKPAKEWVGNLPYPGVNQPGGGTTQQYADSLVKNARERNEWFRTENLLWPWGCDFNNFNATYQFENMDKIVDYINDNNKKGQRYEGVTVQYTTLSEYFTAIHDLNLKWPVRGADDFLPYADQADKTWSGYYTTHGNLKGLARDSMALLHQVEGAMTLSRLSGAYSAKDPLEEIFPLRAAVGEVQHHDGVTGTEQPQVVTMYYEHLTDGAKKALSTAEDIFSSLAGVPKSSLKAKAIDDSFLHLHDDASYVMVYNPLGWPINDVVCIANKFSSPTVTEVASKQTVESQVLTNGNDFRLGPKYFWVNETGIFKQHSASENALCFQAPLPALGYSTFEVAESGHPVKKAPAHSNDDSVSIQNSFYKMTFDKSTGNLQTVTSQLAGGKTVPVTHSLMEYDSFGNDGQGCSAPVSGNYIFRPVGEAHQYGEATIVDVVQGSVVQEVWQNFTAGHYVVYRLHNSNDPLVGGRVEVEYFLGGLNGNREMISRFDTGVDNLNSNNFPEFSTDNNGQQMFVRTFNSTLSDEFTDAGSRVASQYYPLVRSAFIRDSKNDVQFTLLSERTHGCSSLKKGSLEAMLDRRLLQDDCLGEGIPLNFKTPVRARLWFTLADVDTSSSLRARLTTITNTPSIASSISGSVVHPTKSFLKSALPENVHLLTLRSLDDAKPASTMVRLQHLYEKDEDKKLSAPVQFDLADLLPISIVSTEERSLNAIWNVDDLAQKRWTWNAEGEEARATSSVPHVRERFRGRIADETTDISLNPQDIRTFYVTFATK